MTPLTTDRISTPALPTHFFQAESDARAVPAPSVTSHIPNGGALAAIVAAGAGSAALGLATVLAEASPKGVKVFLNLYNPVGPLSGKTTVAVLVYFMTWISLHLVMGGRDMKEKYWLRLSFAMILMGLLLTFPPIYQSFSP